jgi:hypothetical protein
MKSIELPEQEHLGSRDWNEDDFVTAVENCSYPAAEFRHADHIRLAWIYLRRHAVADAGQRISVTIRRFATAAGKPDRYHETITQAWLHLVDRALRATPHECSFTEFIEKHRWLLDRRALAPFYSEALLASAASRVHWVEPDLQPLPGTCPKR